VSRIPRHFEHLKTGSTAEAVSAAKFRAFARQAERQGLDKLAAHWRELAARKDELAIVQLEASGQTAGDAEDLGAAIQDERYENDILYPKLIEGTADAAARAVFEQVLAEQRRHLERLLALRDAFNLSRTDPQMPAETADAGGTTAAGTGTAV
jgi:rubrerythrin